MSVYIVKQYSTGAYAVNEIETIFFINSEWLISIKTKSSIRVQWRSINVLTIWHLSYFCNLLLDFLMCIVRHVWQKETNPDKKQLHGLNSKNVTVAKLAFSLWISPTGNCNIVLCLKNGKPLEWPFWWRECTLAAFTQSERTSFIRSPYHALVLNSSLPSSP